MIGHLRRWWSEMSDFLDPWDAELDADEAELARFRARLNVKTVAMHESDCPLGNCATCQTAAVAEATTPMCQPPAHIGRRANLTESIDETGNWLREHLPEDWYRASPIAIKVEAGRLLHLRAQVEAGRWQV